MRPIATDVARSMIYLSVCWPHGCATGAKTAELIKMPFWEADSCGSLRNHVLDGGQYWTNAFTAVRDDKLPVRFLHNYFGHLLHYHYKAFSHKTDSGEGQTVTKRSPL